MSNKLLRSLTLAFLGAPSLFGYALEGPSWTPNRTVQMQLSLGLPRPLIDGFFSLNESAADALRLWNAQLGHMQFEPILRSSVIPAPRDFEMSVEMNSTIFGDSFGGGVLAVTLLSDRDGIFAETDTIFNVAWRWDSYRGPLRSGIQDFHRVALHEFGHTIGLAHPDEIGQSEIAIMNSHASDADGLQADDIAGAQALYASGPPEQFTVEAPVLANISTRALIGTGDNVLIGGFVVQGPDAATVILRAIGFSLKAQGVADPVRDPVLTVYDSSQRQIAKNDDWTSPPQAETIASYHLDPPSTIESALMLTLQPGVYTAIVESFSGPTQPPEPGVGLFELYDLHTTPGRAGNISTRGQVLGGDNVLIGGFIVGGSEIKTVVVRALGPSLGVAGVANPLPDPALELHNGNGDLLQSNNNWVDGPDADAIKVGGFAPTWPTESALQATLNPGTYTAIVTGVNSATGIGLVEVYDLSETP